MPIEIAPLVLPIAQPTTVVISYLTPGAGYLVRVRSCRQESDLIERELVADSSGRLYLTSAYTVHGEHALDLFPSPAVERLARLSFFVVTSDTFARRPLRCDLHVHTTYSDGRNSPAEMVIRGREVGLDVAVITDHNDYRGSVESMEERERLALNLITMPGEEVSGPNWHILSINADAAIYDLAAEAFGLDSKEKREDWQRTGAWDYSALRWAIEATQAHGGHAYLAHPYWVVERGFHLPTTMYDQVLSEGILNGIELLGDVKYQNNARSLARYMDFCAQGKDIPILGNSDTHGAQHTYGAYWTLVFARDPSPQGVLDAIAGGWSVACTTVKPVHLDDRGDAVQVLGSFELVDYAYYLEQRFFPWHDALCVEEASLAYRTWRGERLPEGTMPEQRARMEALYARCWTNPLPKGDL
jgi:hypothetical protein